jgi:ABC-type glycerol-3-phosphate transport system substrate-binding protein
MDRKLVSRRDFIKAAGVAAGASLLAACAPQATPVTPVATDVPAVPTNTPAPSVVDVWWNTDIPDINELASTWENNPDNEAFKKYWHWGGLAIQKFPPFIEAHPGISLTITSHNWDSALRQNQLMSLAAGIIPDTTYGEAYVNEFVQLGVYAPVAADKAALFADGSIAGATLDGTTYGLAKTSGADVLFVNLDKVEAAGMDPDKLPTTWDELVALAQAISEANKSEKWGNTAYYTYGPGGDSYGQAMRILNWFNSNNAPLGDNRGTPSANIPGAAATWSFHNDLMWTSTEDLILQAEGEGGSGQLFNDGVIALKPGWNNDATSVGAGNINATAIPFPLPPNGKPATIVIGNDIESPFKGGKNPDMGKALVEESTTNEKAQRYFAANGGIWIPAIKSLLEQYETYDDLGGYATETAQKIVRITMKTLLEGGSGPLPGWPKNGSRIWAAWNDMYGRIWKGKLDESAIQAELDTLQTTIEGLVSKNG